MPIVDGPPFVSFVCGPIRTCAGLDENASSGSLNDIVAIQRRGKIRDDRPKHEPEAGG
jgi:hypothetical protein